MRRIGGQLCPLTLSFHALRNENLRPINHVGRNSNQVDKQFIGHVFKITGEAYQFIRSRIKHDDKAETPLREAFRKTFREERRIKRALLIIRPDSIGEALIPALQKVFPEDRLLQRGLIKPTEIRSIGQHLSDDGTTRLRITRQLHFYDHQPTCRLDSQKVGITIREASQ